MRKLQNVLISGWKCCFVQTSALFWKSPISAAHSETKRAARGLKTLLCCFGQTGALRWKALKSGVPREKMTKRRDLFLKTLFCTNSCTLLKSAKKCAHSLKMEKRGDLGLSSAPSAKITKRSVLGLKTSVSCKLVYFATNGLKSSAPCAKLTKRSDLRLKTSVSYKLVHFVKNAKTWCAQCKNDKAFWSRPENAVLYELVHFAEKC